MSAGAGRPTSTPAAPVKTLLLLSVAVLAVHLALLLGTPGSQKSNPPAFTRPLITRTITVAADKPAPAPVQSSPRKVTPRAQEPVAAMPAPTQIPVPTPAEAGVENAPRPPEIKDEPATNSIAPPPSASDSTRAPELAASAPASAAPPTDPSPLAYSVPGSLRLKYDIKGEVRKLSYHASGELLWQHDGEQYEARLAVGAFLLGSRVQTSSGRVTPTGLAPTRFADKVRSEVAAHFERDKGKVIFSANTPEVELQTGAQDQLSIFIQLAGLIAGDPGRYPRGAAIEMQAIGARHSENWRFIVNGEETLSLPGGEQATLKLTRVPRDPYDVTVELWLAPALGYLPARIRLTQSNGDFIDQQLSSSETPP